MEIRQLKDHFYSIEEGHVRCFLAVGEREALVIDAGIEKGLKEKVRTVTDLPLRLILTHADPDHTTAASEFDTVLAHPSEMAYLRSRQKEVLRPQPVWEGDHFDLGRFDFEVILIPGHTPGSIALLERKHRFLLSGDSVQNGVIYLFGDARNDEAFISSMHKLRRRQEEFDLIYGSHGTVEVPLCRIDQCREMVERIQSGQLNGVIADRFDNGVCEFHWKEAGCYHF